jgi:two-component system response regulator NreC
VSGPEDISERPVRIVVADDHPVMRSGLRLVLNSQPGFEVVGTASDARDAARQVHALHPDVLVLDLSMPGESGIDLIPRIRDEAPQTRIVVFTMQRDDVFARRALRSGAVGYVLKDAGDSELVLAVRMAAGGQTYLDPRLGASFAKDAANQRPGDLSDREVKILRMIALGYTNPEIAGKLYLSVRTIEAHRRHIHQKLGVSSRAEIVRFALDHGLVEPLRPGS